MFVMMQKDSNLNTLNFGGGRLVADLEEVEKNVPFWSSVIRNNILFNEEVAVIYSFCKG